ncbi:MAG: tetratricopeptide repeat protein [Ignavibacterium sp.]|jgi:tetratricopeptide (TPR) repeat protein|uniref:tetratricopeptide repeat protein n=1 Tax=Ignavibacterium sp. TaxID=2651167 RepID=UPI0032982EF4
MKRLFVVVILLGLISCSKSLESNFNQANELLKQNKIEEAVAEFTKIAESGDKNFAPKALVQLATIYQNRIDKSISPIESADKAQYFFRTIYDKYPDNPDAPKSLFMSAFILANELDKYDEATKTYNLFLEKFPNHELATSAKQELEYIGLSPEEILKKKMAQQ